jgi:hypothetical protein
MRWFQVVALAVGGSDKGGFGQNFIETIITCITTSIVSYQDRFIDIEMDNQLCFVGRFPVVRRLIIPSVEGSNNGNTMNLYRRV